MIEVNPKINNHCIDYIKIIVVYILQCGVQLSL